MSDETERGTEIYTRGREYAGKHIGKIRAKGLKVTYDIISKTFGDMETIYLKWKFFSRTWTMNKLKGGVVVLITEKNRERWGERKEYKTEMRGVEFIYIYYASCDIFQLGDIINRNMVEVPKVYNGCADFIRNMKVTGIDSEIIGREVLAKTNVKTVQKLGWKTKM